MNELSALPRKASTLTGMNDTCYTASFHSPKPPAGSYSPRTLSEMPAVALKRFKTENEIK